LFWVIIGVVLMTGACKNKTSDDCEIDTSLEGGWTLMFCDGFDGDKGNKKLKMVVPKIIRWAREQEENIKKQISTMAWDASNWYGVRKQKEVCFVED